MSLFPGLHRCKAAQSVVQSQLKSALWTVALQTVNHCCCFADAGLCEAFSLFDKDGDGQITVDEVAQTMASLGIEVQLSDVETMVRQVDTDGKNDNDYNDIHISVPPPQGRKVGGGEC